jgi:c(7)-type cytochrome triheme protein
MVVWWRKLLTMTRIGNATKAVSARPLLILLAVLAALGVYRGVSAEYADVVLNRLSEANDVRPVIFPHWFHRIRFRCKVCHNELGFEMRAGANEITMGKIIDGQYCLRQARPGHRHSRQ